MRAQEAVSDGKKIEDLVSHITALEDRLNSRPADVAEQRRRYNLIQCAITSLL